MKETSTVVSVCAMEEIWGACGVPMGVTDEEMLAVPAPSELTARIFTS
jgi:hypothetical protein